MSDSKFTRKQFLTYGAAGLGALASPHVARGQGAGGGRPNILFVCMDQLRSWQDFPERLPLPAHERLLAEGRGFTRYHVHQAPCGPSRSVIYTGQHVQKTGSTPTLRAT
jgi:arylsulfatase